MVDKITVAVYCCLFSVFNVLMTGSVTFGKYYQPIKALPAVEMSYVTCKWGCCSDKQTTNYYSEDLCSFVFIVLVLQPSALPPAPQQQAGVHSEKALNTTCSSPNRND